MTDVTRTVRSALAEEHAELLAAVCRCADGVAAGWDESVTRERTDVVGSLEAALRQAGVWEELPTALVTAVGAVGGAMQGRPVAGPPYVVMADAGPTLRATVSEGRLLVRLHPFEVDAEGEAPTARYRRRVGPPTDIVSAEFR